MENVNVLLEPLRASLHQVGDISHQLAPLIKQNRQQASEGLGHDLDLFDLNHQPTVSELDMVFTG